MASDHFFPLPEGKVRGRCVSAECLVFPRGIQHVSHEGCLRFQSDFGKFEADLQINSVCLHQKSSAGYQLESNCVHKHTGAFLLPTTRFLCVCEMGLGEISLHPELSCCASLPSASLWVVLN